MLDLADPIAPVARALLLTWVAVLWTIFLVRVVGLRAFSKMTAFDFVTTIATGSLIAQAGTRSDWTSFLQCLAAITAVFSLQFLLAKAQQRSTAARNLLKNQPVLLMEDGIFLEAAMAATRVSRSSVFEKMRAANVTDFSKVRAVILETTGDISVIHGQQLDPQILDGVQRF